MTHKQNLHVHSSYSDGLDRPEETLLTAIERGFARRLILRCCEAISYRGCGC